MEIDTSTLRLGDAITQQQCELVIGFTETERPKQWALAMLQLLQLVKTQLKKQHGRDLTVRIVQNSLHVLTDQEAAQYNPMRFDAGIRMARRAHRRLMAVNVAKLTSVERDQYARNVSTQSFKLSMLRKKTDSELPSTERSTPRMDFQKRRRDA